jgi:hypothetical protein
LNENSEHEAGAPAATRRAYRAPELVEYGSLENLTAGGSFAGGDADGMW